MTVDLERSRSMSSASLAPTVLSPGGELILGLKVVLCSYALDFSLVRR